MSVYVDDMRAQFGSMVMCHMIADSTEELVGMAYKIGLNPRWVQHGGTPKEHFDISMSKRKLAVKHGAIEVTVRQVAMLLRARA